MAQYAGAAIKEAFVMHHGTKPKSTCITAAVIATVACCGGSAYAGNTAEMESAKNSEYIAAVGARIKSQVTRLIGKRHAWQSVDSAPADFPVPLFKGNGTEFLNVTIELPSRGGEQTYHIALRTKDPPTEVVRWYKQALPARGLKIALDAGGKSPAGCEVIRAESDSLSCAVVASVAPVVPQGVSSGSNYQAMIQVTATSRGKR